ncbi:MAG TPA: exodeoxyribonuclease VII small subunit [Dissulfurispiraceae bacterium]|nr:exodeoxyribonuclease VII small subunit [Dissulfurispiraceae bacterium]
MGRSKENKELTYNQAIAELEGIVGDIESEEVDVDALAEKVKRAAELIRFCKEKLRGTGAEVRKVLSEIEPKPAEGDSVEKDLGLI